MGCPCFVASKAGIFYCHNTRFERETVPWTSEFLVSWVVVVLHDRLLRAAHATTLVICTAWVGFVNSLGGQGSRKLQPSQSVISSLVPSPILRLFAESVYGWVGVFYIADACYLCHVNLLSALLWWRMQIYCRPVLTRIRVNPTLRALTSSQLVHAMRSSVPYVLGSGQYSGTSCSTRKAAPAYSRHLSYNEAFPT